MAKKHNIKAKAYQAEGESLWVGLLCFSFLASKWILSCSKHAPSVSNVAKVQTTMDEVVKDFGRLDVFVANAGMAISKPILEQTVEEYKRQMEVNGE